MIENEKMAFQKKLNENTCFYLMASMSAYEEFLSDYNSAKTRALTLSASHFHKAWDSLFLANLKLMDETVSLRSVIQEGKAEAIGRINGITELFLNKKINQTNEFSKSLKVLQGSKYWQSNFESMGKLSERVSSTFDVKLFNSIDFLRHLRNQSEHDFLEASKSDYSTFVSIMNPYLSPVMDAYETMLEEIIIFKRSKGECSKSRTYCKCLSLRKRLRSLKAVVRLPMPGHSLRVEKSSVTVIIKRYLDHYRKNKFPLLKDEKLTRVNTNKSDLVLLLEKEYPYVSLNDVLKSSKSSMSLRRLQTLIEAKGLSKDSRYVLKTYHNGVTRRLYSQRILNELNSGILENDEM